MAKKKPTPVLDDLARNSKDHQFILRMLDEFMSNKDGIVDKALKEMDQRDKAKQRRIDKKRAKDLEVHITADGSSNKAFAIAIKNVGTSIYPNLTLHYEKILLNAESFGIDTTHMTAGSESIAGEEIFMAELAPGEVVTFIREGYGTHEMYNKESKRAARLTFANAESINRNTDITWVYAAIDLPNALKRRTEKFYG